MRTNKRQTIFFPFICQDIQDDPKPPKKNAKYIIKSVNFDSNNEIEISKKIQTILNYSNYFNPIEKDSYINIEELDEEVLTQILKKQPNTDQIYYLFTLKDVSNTSFYKYFYNIHNQKNPKKYVYNINGFTVINRQFYHHVVSCCSVCLYVLSFDKDEQPHLSEQQSNES